MFQRVVLVLAVAAFPLRASALDTKDLLALVAMPLAVAAVSEVTDVPMNDLVDVITLMNQAEVPPTQFIEVVRYAPAVPNLDDVLRARIDAGVTGPALFPAIEAEFVASGLRDVDIDAPRVVTVVDETFVPTIVRTRVAKAHPHGGPPGQLKKDAGVQTGAEIVHVARTKKPREVEVEVHHKPAKAAKHGHEGGGEKHGHGNGKGHGKGQG